MEAGRLARLSRRLGELARAAAGKSGDPELTEGARAVLQDVIRHPDSSISEISDRTGFVQSHVSASVARLRARHLLHTSADPADGRRTRVRVTEEVSRAILRRASQPIDNALASALTPEQAARAGELLEELAGLLLPDSGERELGGDH